MSRRNPYGDFRRSRPPLPRFDIAPAKVGGLAPAGLIHPDSFNLPSVDTSGAKEAAAREIALWRRGLAS